MKTRIFFTALILIISLSQLNSQDISLNGQWSIAVDPTERGVEYDWHQAYTANSTGLVRGWDVVTVPHSFTLDSRFNILGKVWYRKTFTLPENIKNKVCRIRFAAAHYKTRIWVNGVFMGTHEGGYTPFLFDLSRVVKPGVNSISVEVDNRWNDNTIPGSRPETGSKDQVYPWYEYGGITQSVSLLITDKAFIIKQKIEPVIDLKKNTAVINLKTWANLYTDSQQQMTIEGFVAFAESPGTPLVRFAPQTLNAIPFNENLIQIKVSLASNQLKLWDIDQPALYSFTTIIKSGAYTDTMITRTGLRTIEASNGNLLLNGQPVRMGGANRHRDYPGFGSLDPEQVIETDLGLMKSGGMVLTRIHHYPANEIELNWADENGMLIIEEIPVWQNSDVQLADPLYQARVKLQATEMVERDWNRPSIIGWSCGNEYTNWSPEADAYTKKITDFYRSIDPTRLATFVSWMPATLPDNIKVSHNSLRHCDILCVNYYIDKDLEGHFERVHAAFPDKPLIVSEFGKRSDASSEKEREESLLYYLNTIRKYPFIVGASYWTFNDYKSRWPGSNPDGYRPWGLVDENREKLGAYYAVQREFCPLLAEKSPASLKLTSRTDFPSYTVKGYTVRIMQNGKISKEWALPVLKPGMTHTIDLSGVYSPGQVIEVVNPKGFVVYEMK